MNKKMIFVTGLPRSGSTLLCQLLGEHPEIYSTIHSSPLYGALENLRANLSDSEFLLAQLDADFDLVHTRLGNAYQGFMRGWFEETDLPAVVDKNRAWLQAVEMIDELVDDYAVLVCVRDLTQVIGSIEAQHARTRLIDFPDHLNTHSAYVRADTLVGKDGLIGGPLRFIQQAQDILNPEIHKRIYYIPFENLIGNPVKNMQTIYSWLDLKEHAIDPENLTTHQSESDSYYRFKYQHVTRGKIRAPKQHTIVPRIEASLRETFKWYYERFYPNQLTPMQGTQK